MRVELIKGWGEVGEENKAGAVEALARVEAGMPPWVPAE